jgi:hypothetical protein
VTTDAQRRANRENAAKSTGPRTEEGKRRASGNARRHGLSRPPTRSEVMAWYEVITGAPLDQAAVPRSDRERAALDLAEAEAHLASAVREEERFLVALETGENLALQLRRVREIMEEVWRSIPGKSPEVERILLARHGHALQDDPQDQGDVVSRACSPCRHRPLPKGGRGAPPQGAEALD